MLCILSLIVPCACRPRYRWVYSCLCRMGGCRRGTILSDSWARSRKASARPAGRTRVICVTDGLSGEERTPAFCCFRAHISVPQGTAHAFRWFLLSTQTLRNTALWGRNVVRGEEPGPLPCEGAVKGGTRVGPVTGHWHAHLPTKGQRALQQRFALCSV